MAVAHDALTIPVVGADNAHDMLATAVAADDYQIVGLHLIKEAPQTWATQMSVDDVGMMALDQCRDVTGVPQSSRS